MVAALETRCTVLDSESLQQANFEIRPPRGLLEYEGCVTDLAAGCRGWVRRLSRIDWEVGTIVGSHDAVAKASWLSLLASILRYPGMEWLSRFDAINAAENKLTQYTLATMAGVPIPNTMVSNTPQAYSALRRPLIAKPLGPGHYRSSDGSWLTVFTEDFEPRDATDADLLNGPPFVVQERVHANAHLRVVTVNDQAWAFRLEAKGLPTDWREVPQAHRDWVYIQDESLLKKAIKIAKMHGLGYSSQDWIESSNSQIFLDLNPSGQWLFLPEAQSREISESIALWLRGSHEGGI